MQFRHLLSRHWTRRPLYWWQHRAINKQDVMLASYPRSGNTWLRFLLYECVTGKTADFNAINDPHSPLADYPQFHQAPQVTAVAGRIIKTHEPFRREYGRAIHLVRDPRAVVVSEYHYLRDFGFYKGSLVDFVPDFVRGKVNGYGAWHQHTASWLAASGVELCLIRYEDLQQNSEAVLAQVIHFLGLEISAEQLSQVVAHNSLRAMQRSEQETAVLSFVREDARFVRKGQMQSWQTELHDSGIALIEQEMGKVMCQLGYELVNGK